MTTWRGFGPVIIQFIRDNLYMVKKAFIKGLTCLYLGKDALNFHPDDVESALADGWTDKPGGEKTPIHDLTDTELGDTESKTKSGKKRRSVI